MARSVLICLAVIALAIVASAVPAAAAPPNPGNPAGRGSDILGVVPAHAQASVGGGGGNLVYHSGPVVRDYTSYAIYWVPSGYSVSAPYQTLINGFFTNVAAANRAGETANTYFSDTQYWGGSSSNLVSLRGSQFGGSYTDTTPFPATGNCSDSVSQTSICLTDAQLRSEVARVIGAQSWKVDGSSVFFVFTPRGVGSCYSSSSCAFSSYCAYHSSFTVNGASALYANQPYTGTVPSACGSGQSPNGDADADSTINVASHEHNEAITDPLGNAWFDRRGYEDADKCAWTFGSALGGNSGSYYNQVINGAHYYLQRNWSNASSGCVLKGI